MANRSLQTPGETPDNKGPEARAVAIQGFPANGSGPRVVASGRGALAEKIVEIAFANGVKVREDADLAELLSVLDPESEIPLEALTAVAEILAYVYRATARPIPSAPAPVGKSQSRAAS